MSAHLADTQDHKRSEGIFFFQAEDGIRDATVTGVQTCALPICSIKRSALVHRTAELAAFTSRSPASSAAPARRRPRESMVLSRRCVATNAAGMARAVAACSANLSNG